jgi:hypothetical protein
MGVAVRIPQLQFATVRPAGSTEIAAPAYGYPPDYSLSPWKLRLRVPRPFRKPFDLVLTPRTPVPPAIQRTSSGTFF